MNIFLSQQREFFSSHATKDVDFRIQQLQKLRTAILEYEDHIYDALYKDLGKPKVDSYTTEVGFCLHEISHSIKNLKKWARPQKVKNNWVFPFSKSHIQKEPFGNVLIISPWNYPFGLTISPLVSAMSAGNCVTIKPSKKSIHTTQVIQQMLEKYFDKKYIFVFQGGSKETEELLQEKFDYLFFTGSQSVGKIIMEAAAKNLTPLTLELGGKSPCIVDKHCDPDKTASRIVYGKFLNAGQTCIAPDYVLVHTEIKELLLTKMKEKIIAFYGEKSEVSKDYGRIINNQHFKRLKDYLQDVDIIFGGQTDEKNLFIAPTLVENFSVKSSIMQEEIFGPILPIIPYTRQEEAIDFVNQRDKPLALYIFSDDKAFQNTILQQTSSGGVCINDTIIHIANPHLPFGGVGKSGFGKYHGKAGFDTFSHTKSIFKNTTLFEIPKRFPPFDERTLNIVRKIMR